MTDTETRPTPQQIDGVAFEYDKAKAAKAAAAEALERIEAEAIEMVMNFGIVPAHAEKSRRLSGTLAELTVTKSDVIAINDERVDTLKDALYANGYGEFFSKLFAERKKWEIVDGAESALKTDWMPKRLAERVLSLFGRCISVKPKKPSLKVSIADPAKPAKKSRKAKAAAALLVLCAVTLRAQIPDAPRPVPTADRVLLVSIAAAHVEDLLSTRYMLTHGWQEKILPASVARSTPAMLAVGAFDAGVQVMATRFLVRRGHLRTARIIEIAHLGGTLWFATRNWRARPAFNTVNWRKP